MTGPVRQILLRSRVVPLLTAGDYRVVANHDLHTMNLTVAQLPVAEHATHLTVRPPRYVLPPDQVLATFPPATAQGDFGARLPQIVLRRRTLPWERELPNTPAHTPWLALVVVTESEATLLNNVPVAQCATAGALVDPKPEVELGNCLELRQSMVRQVFPTQSEVSLLCHVRQVDLADTELALGDDDGFLAVVVANRLPLPASDGQDHGIPQPYLACLINLEGQFGTLAPAAGTSTVDTARPAAPPALTAVLMGDPLLRFPVLAHWRFTSTAVESIATLMAGLDSELLVAEEPTGHVVLDHRLRRGDSVRSHYRGPLVPFIPTDEPRLPVAHAADQLRIARADGSEDISLAAAFEIGRLLACAAPSKLGSMAAWLEEGYLAVRRQVVWDELDELVDDLVPPPVDHTVGQLLGRALAEQMVQQPGVVLGRPRDLVDPGPGFSAPPPVVGGPGGGGVVITPGGH